MYIGCASIKCAWFLVNRQLHQDPNVLYPRHCRHPLINHRARIPKLFTSTIILEPDLQDVGFKLVVQRIPAESAFTFPIFPTVQVNFLVRFSNLFRSFPLHKYGVSMSRQAVNAKESAKRPAILLPGAMLCYGFFAGLAFFTGIQISV